MTINNSIEITKAQIFRSTTVPVFMPSNMEQPMANDTTTQEQQATLSLFDVKELYDLAYEEKAKGEAGEEAFKKILAEAVRLDLAYRRQLNQKSSYKDSTKLNNFKEATIAKAIGSKVA